MQYIGIANVMERIILLHFTNGGREKSNSNQNQISVKNKVKLVGLGTDILISPISILVFIYMFLIDKRALKKQQPSNPVPVF